MAMFNPFADMQTHEVSEEDMQEAINKASALLKDVSIEHQNNSEKLNALATGAVHTVTHQLSLHLTPDAMSRIVVQVVARLGGLGFLHNLLPPQRTDLTEISVTPDGGVWLQKKGDQDFKPAGLSPSTDEVTRAVLALLAPIRRAVDESSPSVDAKLPRAEGMGGARVKILHPCLVPGKGYYSINIRLFEDKPVTLQKLIDWGMAPEAVLRQLAEMVGAKKARAMIGGGTGTGKTTFQSGLCEGIPRNERIIKIEDPEEIYLAHPHVVTIEARPAPPGSKVASYTVKNGVDDAMRMTPQRLIVGEIRMGDAAMAFFRATMSDHPGLTTFHAETPEDAVYRLAVIMYTDLGVRMEAAKSLIAQALDLYAQVGWRDNKRVLLGVYELGKHLQGGDVHFEPLYQVGDKQLRSMTRR